ncbi:MAG: XdhC family protein, partial [Pirellulaceae bacterium]|nr:XdhC family protein [Pirellulaceae bacterium]
ILVTLDCQVYCFDPRQEWIDRLPASPNLSAVCDPNPSERVIELDDQSFVLCMTMGHKTDRPILEEIFRQERRFPYLGVIGSQSKRKVLIRELTEAGIPKDVADQFHCPIGLDVGSNQPGEIAISVAAQLLGERDRVKT